MAVDLNASLDDDILDSYNWHWLNMGDDRVCPDCEALAALDPVTFTEWEERRTLPGRGDTVCGDHCRCVMVPVDMVTMFPDLISGGKIVIRDIGDLVVTADVTYEMFWEFDDLLKQYQRQGGPKLPPEFYAIETVEGRIGYLKDWLRDNAG